LVKKGINWTNKYRRDNLKIPAETKGILKAIIPGWYGKLEKAGWNIKNLSYFDKGTIISDSNTCLIGELNCMSSAYIDSNSWLVGDDNEYSYGKNCALCLCLLHDSIR